jgi:hypothetical protein
LGYRFLIHPPGWGLAETHVSHELVAADDSPVVALAKFHDGEWTYFPRGSLEREEIESAIAEAVAYLTAQETSWAIEETRGFFGFFKRPAHASATGGVDLDLLGKGPRDRIEYGLTMKIAGAYVSDDFVPERLLVPAVLRRVAEQLGSASILVIIPKRGILVAAPGGPTDIPAVMQWAASARNFYADAKEAAICPHVFFVQDGQIVGVNAAKGDGSYAMSLQRAGDEDWFA